MASRIIWRRNLSSLYASLCWLAHTEMHETKSFLIASFLKVSGMLKITKVVLSEKEITLQLDGRVSGQWVELLRETTESMLNQGVKLSVDLKNISFIDCEGIALIRNLIERGVRHTNPPLFVAEQIKRCKDGTA